MKVLGSYKNAKEATTKALKTLISYMLDADSKMHQDFAKQYAPTILNESSTKIKSKKSPLAVVVFDIDDTLLFGWDNVTENDEVVKLLKRLKDLKAEIHLITARLKSKEVNILTKEHLKTLGLEDFYHSLSLAPDKYRTSMAEVSKWKMETRKSIASMYQIPITLTVGDQWGDMVVLDKDETILELDNQYHHKLYHFVRPEDKVSLWGLKLPDHK